MKGVIVLALKEMVVQKFGKNKWEAALKAAGIEKEPIILATSDVDDGVALKVVQSLCKELGITLQQAADAFGDYWVTVYAPRQYAPFFRGASSAREFLLKMDHIHVAVTKNIPGAKPPRFEYEEKGDALIIKYKSHRGLIDFLVGLIKGVGKKFGEDLKVVKLGPDKVMVTFR
jgi:hypothetical protein